MITPQYVKTMAAYNLWQNNSLISAADGLDDEERKKDRGAFWSSIEKTLIHLLWGDKLWLQRFGCDVGDVVQGLEGSAEHQPDWGAFKPEREATDQTIVDWAKTISETTINDNLTWVSSTTGREMKSPMGPILVHFFNHQTHHRGQVHSMLTAAGASPDRTDLVFMPDNYKSKLGL